MARQLIHCSPNYSVCTDDENYRIFAIRNDEGGAGVYTYILYPNAHGKWSGIITAVLKSL